MDLGAFLRPGGVFVISARPAGDDIGPAAEAVEGRLLERRGRPLWLLPKPAAPGSQRIVTVCLPGYNLLSDGSLSSAGDENQVSVSIVGQVRGCRRLLGGRFYLWRLSLLGRLWSDE